MLEVAGDVYKLRMKSKTVSNKILTFNQNLKREQEMLMNLHKKFHHVFRKMLNKNRNYNLLNP